MKKLILLVAVILGFAFTYLMKVDTAPEFKFESETHDFGKIAKNKPVSHQFKFTNIGDEPLIISTVDPNCDCITVKFTSGPIKKGATGTVDIIYNAAVAIPFSKPVTIKSNARTPIKMLYVKGEVVQ